MTQYPRKFGQNDPLIPCWSSVYLNKKNGCLTCSLYHSTRAGKRYIAAVQKLFESLKQDKISSVKYSVFLLGENIFIHLIECQKDECIDTLNMRADVREFLAGMVSRLQEDPIPICVQNIAVLNESYQNSPCIL